METPGGGGRWRIPSSVEARQAACLTPPRKEKRRPRDTSARRRPPSFAFSVTTASRALPAGLFPPPTEFELGLDDGEVPWPTPLPPPASGLRSFPPRRSKRSRGWLDVQGLGTQAPAPPLFSPGGLSRGLRAPEGRPQTRAVGVRPPRSVAR